MRPAVVDDICRPTPCLSPRGWGGGSCAIVLALALVFLASPAGAETAGEPSALACDAFRADMAGALSRAPDSLQVNNLLFDAARKGCVGSLDALLKAGASRLARDRGGATALSIAARAGRLAFVQALLAGAAPEEATQLNEPNVTGSTPLMEAAFGDRLEVAKALIAAGTAVNSANRQGETALSVAAFHGDAELATLLLARGAKPDTVDATGKGVILYAAARGADRIVARLIDAGVDVNARYRADLTALMWAAGHADNVAAEAGARTVKLLLARGAQIDGVDDRGMTALMIAAALGHEAVARELVAAGADRRPRDKAGKTAADHALAPDPKTVLAPP
jgi:ankyrin repeat protein